MTAPLAAEMPDGNEAGEDADLDPVDSANAEALSLVLSNGLSFDDGSEGELDPWQLDPDAHPDPDQPIIPTDDDGQMLMGLFAGVAATGDNPYYLFLIPNQVNDPFVVDHQTSFTLTFGMTKDSSDSFYFYNFTSNKWSAYTSTGYNFAAFYNELKDGALSGSFVMFDD